jgi:[acyl-carrier-protein] S-malonyltransferase
MNIAWLFPGQGSQSVGMGRELAAASPAARDVFARADACLEAPISPLCFEGPEAELTLTANAQPAIVATSAALLAALRERVPSLPPPTCAAGHSLGEYAALVAAGALSLEDAVRIVRRRGLAMQDAVAPGVGAMAAIVALADDVVESICAEAAGGEVVGPANFNAPGQVVIAGHAGAVERACRLADARGGKGIPLKVSAPFHCALMAPAARAVDDALASAPLAPLAFPVYANCDARPNRDPARVRELLVRQVDSPVRWEATIRAMAEAGVTHAFEIGPGKVLGNMMKRIAKSIQVVQVSDLAGIDAAAKLVA